MNFKLLEIAGAAAKRDTQIQCPRINIPESISRQKLSTAVTIAFLAIADEEP